MTKDEIIKELAGRLLSIGFQRIDQQLPGSYTTTLFSLLTVAQAEQMVRIALDGFNVTQTPPPYDPVLAADEDDPPPSFFRDEEELAKSLGEPIISGAFRDGRITDYSLVLRLIRERGAAAAAIRSLKEDATANRNAHAAAEAAYSVAAAAANGFRDELKVARDEIASLQGEFDAMIKKLTDKEGERVAALDGMCAAEERTEAAVADYSRLYRGLKRLLKDEKRAAE